MGLRDVEAGETGQTIRAAVAAEMPLTYDGGTDLSLLNELTKADEKGTKMFDYAVVCTDGIDNFKRRPVGDDYCLFLGPERRVIHEMNADY